MDSDIAVGTNCACVGGSHVASDERPQIEANSVQRRHLFSIILTNSVTHIDTQISHRSTVFLSDFSLFYRLVLVFSACRHTTTLERRRNHAERTT